MTNKPSLRKSNPVLLRMIGQAAVKAGTDNDEPGMVAAGERASPAARGGGRGRVAESDQEGQERLRDRERAQDDHREVDNAGITTKPGTTGKTLPRSG